MLLSIYPSSLGKEDVANGRALSIKLKRQPMVLAEMGIETPFEKKILDFLGISTLWDWDKDTAHSFTLKPMLILLKPTKSFIPKYAIVNSPKTPRLAEIETPQLLDLNHFWLFDSGSDPWWKSDSDTISRWMNSVLSGTVFPSILKTEPEEYRSQGSITQLSARGLSKLMADSRSNIVLYARTSWCAHCMKVDPIFRKVAEAYSTTEILFATLNLDLNSLPLFRVRSRDGNVEYKSLIYEGPPLILLLSSNHDVPVVYDGERTTFGLTEAVAYHFAHLLRSVPDEL
eukprot:Gregarina_sp_Poly_1__2844@NODE_1793_length_3321_cov_76_000000_g1167_i0_p2_GENE_NODE_1793_length_3321_cov_76_000000_g1167_i0NODE_1793_length_3321_cov_76_000000_g1167_i0_p2_ORF_typecomplete_len286_score21_13Thioredoxin/PF00085_20/1_5e07TraF/PF13728_6/0_0071Thioredoxin_6/PF13848_6/0_13Thioredoxin_6/PF13848_6/4e02Thioredoxin_9/PF14595_6/0_073Thioredoxin_8/PF13905_6/5_6e03Thioredoxin_8/PF13905_6/0_13DUF953/PF06110_11/0_17AhpCTSA/PF00578_21/7_4e02AhpCTSA/PF00578_21/0_6OST3_OST6/PF04756_13/0_18_NODE_17